MVSKLKNNPPTSKSIGLILLVRLGSRYLVTVSAIERIAVDNVDCIYLVPLSNSKGNSIDMEQVCKMYEGVGKR